jgi:hypothetical protein
VRKFQGLLGLGSFNPGFVVLILNLFASKFIAEKSTSRTNQLNYVQAVVLAEDMKTELVFYLAKPVSSLYAENQAKGVGLKQMFSGAKFIYEDRDGNTGVQLTRFSTSRFRTKVLHHLGRRRCVMLCLTHTITTLCHALHDDVLCWTAAGAGPSGLQEPLRPRRAGPHRPGPPAPGGRRLPLLRQARLRRPACNGPAPPRSPTGARPGPGLDVAHQKEYRFLCSRRRQIWSPSRRD